MTPRPAPVRAGIVTAIAAAVVLATVAAGTLAMVGAARPVGAQERPAGRVGLASQTPWVAGGDTFTVRLDVEGVRRPEEVEVAVTVHRAITSRSQFARTLEGSLLGARVRERVAPLTALVYDAGGAVPVALGPGDLPLLGPSGDRGGVHPVAVELRERGGGPRIDGFVTYLVRVPAATVEPLGVAWVQPLGAPPALQPDGGVAIPPADLARLEATTAELAAAPDVPVTLVPTAETLDALTRTGNDRLVEPLAGALAGRQVVAEGYVDVDVAAMADAELAGELATQRTRAAEVLAAELGARPDTRTWVVDDPLDDAALATLRQLAVDRLVIPEEHLAPMDRRLTLAEPFVVQDPLGRRFEAVAVDPGLSAHLAATDDPVLAASRLLADLAVLFFDEPARRRGVVVRAPADADAPPPEELLSAVLAGLATSPILEPVTLDGLFGRVALLTDGTDGGTVVRGPADDAPPAPTPLPRRAVLDRRAEVEGFASMVSADNDDLELVRRLLLVAQSGALTPSGVRAYLDAVGDRLREQVATVRVADDNDFRLTAREGSIAVTLLKDVPHPVTVAVTLESDRLEFEDAADPAAGRYEVVVRLERETTAVVVPVRARGSGAFPLTISVTSPEGDLRVAAARITVRSTFVSGVGVALSAGAGLFLVVWWLRHWRTARRDRRLVEPPG